MTYIPTDKVQALVAWLNAASAETPRRWERDYDEGASSAFDLAKTKVESLLASAVEGVVIPHYVADGLLDVISNRRTISPTGELAADIRAAIEQSKGEV